MERGGVRVIRVLHVFHKMGNGGIEHFVMDRYRRIDRERLQFDFLITSACEGYFDREIEALGGRIFHSSVPQRHPVRAFREIAGIVRKGGYDIVQRHTGNAVAYFDLRAARHGGARHLIMHSHNNSARNKSLHRTVKLLLPINCVRLACSDAAGKWLFGRRAFTVIPNAIDTEAYRFDAVQRDAFRRKYNLTDSFVIGNIGRLDIQKNQRFLIDILAAVKQKMPSAKLLILGDGRLKQELLDYAASHQLAEDVVLPGQVDDVSAQINAMDVYCLPSLYEGLGITLIEAQANGLWCCTTKGSVPQDANASGRITYIPLEDGPEVWAQALMRHRERSDMGMSELRRQFSIEEQIDRMERFYYSLEEADT